MMIFDCFKFFNEFELIELRFMTLDSLVNYFVLVEANKTHTGKPKEFLFEKKKYKYAKYLDKIIYVKVEDLPDYSIDDIWLAENFQRNCIMRGLEGVAKKGDKIIISDADEIPNSETIRGCLNLTNPVAMIQKLFYYYVNCLQNQPWWGSALGTYGEFKVPQELRNMARGGSNLISNGGWHYSFMGGPEKIKIKVENIAESHLIINDVGSLNDIERKINTQQDLWGRGGYDVQKRIVDINKEGMAPKEIFKFLEKYPNFLFKQKK